MGERIILSNKVDEEGWVDICVTPANTANSRSGREFRWKNLIWFFITPKLTAIQNGKSFSYFLACSKMASYWHEGAAENGKILREDFSFIMHNSRPLASSQKAITRKWFQVDPPTKNQCLGIVNEIHCMERLAFTVRINLEKCIKYWDTWIVYTYHWK